VGIHLLLFAVHTTAAVQGLQMVPNALHLEARQHASLGTTTRHWAQLRWLSVVARPPNDGHDKGGRDCIAVVLAHSPARTPFVRRVIMILGWEDKLTNICMMDNDSQTLDWMERPPIIGICWQPSWVSIFSGPWQRHGLVFMVLFA
jgi:hypothetical protein